MVNSFERANLIAFHGTRLRHLAMNAPDNSTAVYLRRVYRATLKRTVRELADLGVDQNVVAHVLSGTVYGGDVGCA